jgi:hypothetical protein
MLRPVLVCVAALVAILTLGTGPAAVAAPTSASTVATGYDVSYPQCGVQLPERGDIAVVGVNAGTGTTTNPCLAEQLAWGDAPAANGAERLADVYVNTANPGRLGDWWPGSDLARGGRPVTNPEGSCAGAEDAACAYVYGYSIALDDLWSRGVSSPGERTWWLDVETMNSWSWNREANLAVLEGMAAAIRSAGAEVGVYSTAHQWGLIIGDAAPSSALGGAPVWLAGAVTREGALANCATAPLTPGGRVRMVQWVEHGLDHDIACGVGVSGTRPALDGAVALGSRVVADPGAWGPSGVRLRYLWTRDGMPIEGATDAAYMPAAEDLGAALAVTVTGDRLGVPSLSLTSDAVVVAADAPAQPDAPAGTMIQRAGF